MINHFQTKVITSAILATMLGLSACSNSDDKEESTTPETAETQDVSKEETPEATPAPAEEAADPQEKLNAYIDCSNGTMSRFYESFNRYELWVDDMEGGPTGNESHIYGLYSLSEHSVEDCATNAAAATKMAPSLPELDQAAADYVTAIQEYDEVSRKADDYYEQGNYKDDNFALGKELHPQLVSAFEKADKAAEKFDTLLGDFNKKVRNQRLTELEQTEGKKFSYHLLSLSLKAEDMVNYITQEDFDADKAQTLIEEYEKAAKALKDYSDTKAEDVPITISTMDTQVDSLLVASKNRMRHIRDGEEFTQAEIGNLNSGAGWMVEGSADRVIKDYNSLIQTLNNFN